MRNLVSLGAMTLVAACAAKTSQVMIPPPLPVTIVDPVLPKGASMSGTSTFATILEAPPSLIGDVTPQRNDFVGQEDWYARENGISVAEAKRRMADQQAISAEVEQLRVRLTALEGDNYTGVRMVHQPDWGYVFYFKRDAAATLARHTRNPRFRAAQGRFTDAEIKALVQPWAERFGRAGIMGGYGLDGTTGTAQMMMSVDREEYRAIAEREGWGTPPDGIALEFSRSPGRPAVDPRVAHLLRGFAFERRATVVQLEAGSSGRIVLSDGCLRLDKADGPLVVFHRETGIGLDGQAYLALIDRHSGKPLGRIGEMLSWAGPNQAKDYVGLDELKAACGEGPVFNAGSPESQARFEARYPSAKSRR